MSAVQATYFTSSDKVYFPGTVALINSIRLTGHRGEIVVFDLGLRKDQRRRLSTVATVEKPAAIPSCGKVIPSSDRASGVVVVVDSDMLVVAALDRILDAAEHGKICVYPDPDDRWFALWREIFELGAPLRNQRYANAGLVALSLEHWPGLLERWAEANARLPVTRPAHLTDPVRNLDQDALNALLMSEIPADGVLLLPEIGESHPGALHRVLVHKPDLSCEYLRQRVTILHHSLRPKVWEPSGYRRDFRQAYIRLLPRVLFASDVPLRLDPNELPLWLRPTIAGRVARRAGALGYATPGLKHAAKTVVRKSPS